MTMAGNEIEIVVTSSDKTDLSKIGARAEKAGESAGKKWGGRFAKAAAGAGALAGGLLAKGLADNMNISAANSKLRGQLGLSKADAAKAGEVAGKVYRDNWGGSIDDVNEAIRSVASNLGDVSTTSQADLQAMTEKALALADTFGVDIPKATEAAGKMVKNGLAKDSAEAFDIITRGMQTGADKAGDFLDTINEYSPHFAQMGISGAGALKLLQEGLQGGARDTDIIADSFKEFSLRAIDNSSRSRSAFKDLGMDVNATVTAFGKGGPAAAGMTQQVLRHLNAIKDPIERDRLGVALFNTQWEDGLKRVLPAMAKVDVMQDAVRGSTDEMMAAVGENGKAKIETAKRVFEGWTQSLASSKGPLGDVATGTLAFGAPALMMASQVGMLVSGMAALNLGMLRAGAVQAALAVKTALVTAAQWALNAAMSANPIMLAVLAVAALAAGLIYAYRHSETFRRVVDGAFRAVARAAQATWGWIKAQWPALFAVLTGPIGLAVRLIARHWGSIRRGVSGLGRYIAEVFSGLYHAITDPIERAVSYITDKLGSVGGAIGGALGHLPGFAHGGIVGGAASGLTMVGEHGRELVRPAAGSRVHSNPDTERMLAEGGSSGEMVHRIVIEGTGLLAGLRKEIRIQGGSVQAVLGRA
jgi:phage-related minor tail protein